MRMMVHGCFSLILLVALTGSVQAEVGPESPAQLFPGLSRLEVDPDWAFIYYNPDVSVILMQPVAGRVGVTRVMHTRIAANADQEYIVDYDSGPSGDPTFIISRKDVGALVELARLGGTELTMPGDGSIYVSGGINNFFNKRRKYVLLNGRLDEVPQPFYFVGLTTTTTTQLELYSDGTKRVTVAQLPPNSKVEVLIARGDFKSGYEVLVKTQYGLVGWVSVNYENGSCGTEVIKGICFHGD